MAITSTLEPSIASIGLSELILGWSEEGGSCLMTLSGKAQKEAVIEKRSFFRDGQASRLSTFPRPRQPKSAPICLFSTDPHADRGGQVYQSESRLTPGAD